MSLKIAQNALSSKLKIEKKSHFSGKTERVVGGIWKRGAFKVAIKKEAKKREFIKSELKRQNALRRANSTSEGPETEEEKSLVERNLSILKSLNKSERESIAIKKVSA